MKSKSAVDVVQGDLFSGFGSITTAGTDPVGEVLSMPDAKLLLQKPL